MQADPYLQFREDDNRQWYLHNLETGEDYRSSEDENHYRDFGYLGRLTRPDGKGTFLVAAGIHPAGLQGAIALLESDMADLYVTVRDARFSLAVSCEHDPQTLTVTGVERITPIYRHTTKR